METTETVEIPILHNTIRRKCPYCSSTCTDRISRGKVAKLMFSWLSLKRYICGKCFKKHYRLN